MTLTTMYSITEKESLTAKAQLVLTNLVRRSNKEDKCFPGLKRIAADCKISVSSVQRALRELLEHGLIMKVHNFRANGSQTSNIYTVISDESLKNELKDANLREDDENVLEEKSEGSTEKIEKENMFVDNEKQIHNKQEQICFNTNAIQNTDCDCESISEPQTSGKIEDKEEICPDFKEEIDEVKCVTKSVTQQKNINSYHKNIKIYKHCRLGFAKAKVRIVRKIVYSAEKTRIKKSIIKRLQFSYLTRGDSQNDYPGT